MRHSRHVALEAQNRGEDPGAKNCKYVYKVEPQQPGSQNRAPRPCPGGQNHLRQLLNCQESGPSGRGYHRGWGNRVPVSQQLLQGCRSGAAHRRRTDPGPN